MVKKYSKYTFRHTKKNVLHKKGVNSKKRGLRGGAIDTRAIIDEQGLHGITKQFTFSREKDLTQEVCGNWFEKIKINEKLNNAFDGNGTLKTTSTGRKDYDICSSKKINNPLKEHSLLMKNAIDQAKKQGKRVTQLSSEEFKTKLETNKTTMGQDGEPYYVSLTLDDCVAKKNPYSVSGEQTPFFEYSIYSPTATTEPPFGGLSTNPNGTLVGTFTQLPISFLLRVAKQETPFSFASFYKTNEDRKPYFSDYLSCLENVQQKFGPEVDRIDGSISQSDKFRSIESSILRQFGKSAQCKIVLVAGNVGIQIQDPVNGDAIFVLPSQLNGAEYKYPEQAKTIKLNDYKEDPTAGPLGQLSFHPVVDQFVMDHAERGLPNGENFTSDFLVINAIDDVILELLTLDITSLTLNNGYLQVPINLNNSQELVLKDGGSENPSQNAIAIFDSLSTRLKVLQTDDVPTSGLKPPREYKEFNSVSNTKATPIYASAVPLNYEYIPPSSNSNNIIAINSEKSTLQYCVAGFDLVAQYFGAMVSAYNKSKKLGEAQGKKVKLFLTPLGGGVFNNPREMIACSVLLAYYQAQQLFSDFDNSVQVIFLAWDRNPNEVGDFGKFFNTKEEQESLPEATLVEILHPSDTEIKNDGDDDDYPTDGWTLGAIKNPNKDVGVNKDVDVDEDEDEDVLTGDKLYEKHKDPSQVLSLNDAESYRKRVLKKFESEESDYDNEFSDLPKKHIKPTEYQVEIVKSVISRNIDLFNKLMELLSLTSSENLYTKLLFIQGIFIKCNLSDTSCSKIYTIILGLIINLSTQRGGSKSRRKPVRKTRRGRGRTRKSKSKTKPRTHRRRRHSRVRVRKHKKYTSRGR